MVRLSEHVCYTGSSLCLGGSEPAPWPLSLVLLSPQNAKIKLEGLHAFHVTERKYCALTAAGFVVTSASATLTWEGESCGMPRHTFKLTRDADIPSSDARLHDRILAAFISAASIRDTIGQLPVTWAIVPFHSERAPCA